MASDVSEITINGGLVLGSLAAQDSSTITVTGGEVRGDILAFHSSAITIVGTGFAVDGGPVGYGMIMALDGMLTGMLDSGEMINTRFCHGGSGACTGGQGVIGVITLTNIPEPTTALLIGIGLVGIAGRRRV